MVSPTSMHSGPRLFLSNQSSFGGDLSNECEVSTFPCDLSDPYHVSAFQKGCRAQHEHNGWIRHSLLGLAIIVTAIWIGVSTGSFVIGVASFLIVSTIIVNLDKCLENRDLLNAAELSKDFIDYIRRSNEPLFTDTVVPLYQKYQAQLTKEATDLG